MIKEKVLHAFTRSECGSDKMALETDAEVRTLSSLNMLNSMIAYGVSYTWKKKVKIMSIPS